MKADDQGKREGTGLLQRLQARGIKQPPLDLTWLERRIAEARAPLEAGPDDDTAPPQRAAEVKRTRRRKPSLVSVARQAAKASLEVARYEVDPDGKIVVITGKPGDVTKPENGNEWDGVLQ